MKINTTFFLLFLLPFVFQSDHIVYLPFISNILPPPPIAPNANIIFFILDDGSIDIDLYGGNAHTPNINKIGNQGIVFGQAVANATGCNPSRVSFATGLLPVSNCITSMDDLNENSTSMTRWRQYMNECSVAVSKFGPSVGTNILTLWRTFSQNGYHTFAVGKVMHQQAQQWPEFDKNYWSSSGELINSASNIPLHGLTDFYAAGSRLADWGAIEDLRGVNGETFTERAHQDWISTDKFIKFLKDAPSDRPFLGALGLTASHIPRYVPQRLLDLYADVPLPDVLLNDADDLPQSALDITTGYDYQQLVVRNILTDNRQWRKFVQSYYAGITFADEQIGRVLQAIEEIDRKQNTIIVIWSDHGYHLGQKLKIEKGSLWHESNAIPLIISIPGVKSAKINSAVNSIDVFPTLLELTGVNQIDNYARDGKSLVQMIVDGESDITSHSVIIYGDDIAIEQNKKLFILYQALSGQNLQTELYDLQRDPNQWKNLSGHDAMVKVEGDLRSLAESYAFYYRSHSH